MKRVAFHTLGCKVNQYETEVIAELFEKDGYKTVDFNQAADVYVINTCTVTNLGERKSGQMIRRARNNNEDAIVVVMGCYAQVAQDEVSQIPGVNIIIGTKNKEKVVDFVKQFEMYKDQIVDVGNIMAQKQFEDLEIAAYRDRTRAFIKIQDGCDRFCSYCVIPYARGPVRSRRPEAIIDEVKRLSQNGYSEVVLTGIHVASYGKDLKNTGLIDIITELHKIEGISRIRLSSIEPLAINREFIDKCKELYKLCPHYHISLQSGCDSTLKRMNRRYTTQQFREVVELLRNNIPDVSITTDIIVGFPGETAEEFEQTYEFVKEMGFSKTHVFKYSRRKGTPAADFPNQVKNKDKQLRSDRLLQLDLENQKRFRRQLLDSEVEVLFEREVKDKPGYMEGLTGNYVDVAAKGDVSLKGSIRRVKLSHIESNYIIGDIIR